MSVVDVNVKVSRAMDAVFSRRWIPESISVVVLLGSVGLGIYVLFGSATMDKSPTFSVARDMAPMTTWGAILIILSLCAIASLLGRRKDAWWPLFGCTLWYTLWSMSVILSVQHRHGIGSAIAVYLTITLILALLSAMYMREGVGNGGRN